jgi:hypothetical protein
MAGGVGAGKSFSTSRKADAYSATENGLGWIIGPSYELARPEFDYLYTPYADLGMVADGASLSSRGSCKFSLTKDWGGFTWVTKSSTELETLAGRRPDVIIVTEAAQHPSGIRSKVEERAAERRAPIIYSGTFEGAHGWYAEQWEIWQGPNQDNGRSFSVPTWTNLTHFPGGRQDPEILRLERSMPPEVFLERFGGVPCPPAGLVFKSFSPKYHVDSLEKLYNPDLPVEVWVDPATHCYAILFVQKQKDGKTFHVLDEIYARDRIAQDIIPEVVESPFWKAGCTSGVMDIAGKTRAMGGQSQLEVWETELKRLNTHPIEWFTAKWPQEEKRNAISLRLWSGEGHPPKDEEGKPLAEGRAGGPLLFFSDTLNQYVTADGRANGIIGELKTYRWAQRGEMVADPRHPIKKNEDAISALGYGLLKHCGPVVKRPNRSKMKIRGYA